MQTMSGRCQALSSFKTKSSPATQKGPALLWLPRFPIIQALITMLTVALQAALRAQRPIPPKGLAEIVREVTPSASCTTPTQQHLKEGYAHGIPSLHSPSPLSPGGGPSTLSPRASQREIEGVDWRRALAFQHESSVFALPAHLASAGVDAHTMQQATAAIDIAPVSFPTHTGNAVWVHPPPSILVCRVTAWT